jgi:hypothetical protein
MVHLRFSDKKIQVAPQTGVLFEKNTSLSVKKFSAVYETRRFTALLTYKTR